MSSSGQNFDESPIGRGPNDTIKFKVIALDNKSSGTSEQNTALFEFAPKFYPDRFNQKFKKDLRREGQQCKGEDVSIKKNENSQFHATGVLLEENLRLFQTLSNHQGVVDLMTPISPDGGMECYIESADVGEIEGWNPSERQWMFKYTMDLVSTGLDEFGNNSENDIVTSQLNQ
jgi:hypothetical protein